VEITTIPVKKETKKRLKMLGRKDETWDEFMNRLAEIIEHEKQ
jgi:hypothetical protein